MTELHTALTVTGALALLIGLGGTGYIAMGESWAGIESTLVLALVGFVSLTAGYLMWSIPRRTRHTA